MENGVEMGFIRLAQMGTGNVLCFIGELAFLLFLLVFSWQDFHRKRIRVSWLYGFGTVGMALTFIRCVLTVMEDGWDWKRSAVGMVAWMFGLLPGAFLLWMEHHTQGAVGRGDGCFFLITGCYLGGWRTFGLLMGAVFVSSLAGGIWMLMKLPGKRGNGLWEEIRKKKLPFLPCVIPVWIWMMLAAVG